MQCYDFYLDCTLNCPNDCSDNSGVYCCFDASKIAWWIWLIVAIVGVSILACIGCCIGCCVACCKKNNLERQTLLIQPQMMNSGMIPQVRAQNAYSQEQANGQKNLLDI
ncbi:Hypothetical_protein [Hexamita inflata]|uniref:Hypothetical_protein n=1 Tax=Hexamita inflata TaxID=28002 RepID=A0AA86N4A2_9EUKA|nr:Hypothetical protein HINF_LOCUS205 [Hexamita inflata]CAI9924717.1 Hypothetical protein HINF_LOCUS12362 [Hexamita inflata]